MMIRMILLSIFLLCLYGCLANSVMVEPAVRITNNTGKPINKIVYQECGRTDNVWLPTVLLFPIESNSSINFTLPVDCADLKAYFATGEVAGSQQNIKKKFPLSWVLY